MSFKKNIKSISFHLNLAWRSSSSIKFMKSNGEATGQREITTLVQNQYVVATRVKINRELDVTCTSIGDMEVIC